MCTSTKGQNWPITQNTYLSNVLWVSKTKNNIGIESGCSKVRGSFPYVSGIYREIERKYDDPNQMKKRDPMFMLQH